MLLEFFRKLLFLKKNQTMYSLTPPVQGLGEWSDHAHCGFLPPLAAEQDGALLYGDQWATSTPERKDGRPVNFDGGRVKAWLRVQSSTSPERAACCSKAVQTDGEEKVG